MSQERVIAVPADEDEELPSSQLGALGRSSTGLLYPVVTVAATVIIWEVATTQLRVPKYLLPPPSDVIGMINEQGPILLEHAQVTTVEILAGFLLSLIIGIPLAAMIAYSRVFERSVYPLLVASQAIPKVAIAPLFIVWLGFGWTPKIVVAFLVAVFPIVVDTALGLRSTPPEMFHLVRSMGANPIERFTKVQLPCALPHVFAGLKVAIALAVVGAIVGEFVGSDRGLGYIMLVANGQLQTTLLFASIVVLSVIAVVLYSIVELLERLLIPWHVSARAEGGE